MWLWAQGFGPWIDFLGLTIGKLLQRFGTNENITDVIADSEYPCAGDDRQELSNRN